MSVLERYSVPPWDMKQFWAKTQSSYIFEESELLIPDDNLNFFI